MSKRWTLGVVASLVVASIGFAAPAAHAEECDPRIPEFGDGSLNTIYFEDGVLKVNPNGVEPDLAIILPWIVDRADAVLDCVLPLIPPQVGCALSKLFEIVESMDPLAPDLRYVFFDQSTQTLGLRYQLLLDDATACLP